MKTVWLGTYVLEHTGLLIKRMPFGNKPRGVGFVGDDLTMWVERGEGGGEEERTFMVIGGNRMYAISDEDEAIYIGTGCNAEGELRHVYELTGGEKND